MQTRDGWSQDGARDRREGSAHPPTRRWVRTLPPAVGKSGTSRSVMHAARWWLHPSSPVSPRPDALQCRRHDAGRGGWERTWRQRGGGQDADARSHEHVGGAPQAAARCTGAPAAGRQPSLIHGRPLSGDKGDDGRGCSSACSIVSTSPSPSELSCEVGGAGTCGGGIEAASTTSRSPPSPGRSGTTPS